jgi:ABC-type uncharacterized transport system permease subunit
MTALTRLLVAGLIEALALAAIVIAVVAGKLPAIVALALILAVSYAMAGFIWRLIGPVNRRRSDHGD